MSRGGVAGAVCAVALACGRDPGEPQQPGVGPSSHALTVAVTGPGSVTSSPAGINCGMACSLSVVSGTALTLTATADPGGVFRGWNGACSGTGACALDMSADAAVVATFTGTSALLERGSQ